MMRYVVWLSICASVLLFSACNDPVGPGGPPDVTGDTITLASGLQYIDIRAGTGTQAETGHTVRVHYTGWLAENGTRFDTSRTAGRQPLVITLGRRDVIAGWEEGIPGMRVGGQRRLIIPPHLAYGEAGRPGIPPNATLIFDIDLLGITN